MHYALREQAPTRIDLNAIIQPKTVKQITPKNAIYKIYSICNDKAENYLFIRLFTYLPTYLLTKVKVI